MYTPYAPTILRREEPVVLGIESSCDETAAAVVRGRTVLSDEIASSADVQSLYGGVVPEIASRAHTEAVSAVVERAVKKAGIGYGDLDAVAVTYGAGLLGALLVGCPLPRRRLCAEQTPHRGGPYPRASRRRLYQRARSGAALRHPARQRRAHGRPVRRVGGEIQDTRRNAGRRGGRGVRQGGAGFGPEIPGRAQHRAVHPRGERETRHSHAENAEGGRRL